MLTKIVSLLLLTLSLSVFAGCTNAENEAKEPSEEAPIEEPTEEEPTEEEPEVEDQSYLSGTYRGIFEDSGEQQVSVQFKLADGMIQDMRFRHLYYKDVNYTKLEENDPLYGILAQHIQLAEYFEGKPLSSLVDLADTSAFIDDVDVATGATLRGNKILAAIKDGLNRGLYATEGEYLLDLPTYQNGTYRGIYGDAGEQQVSIQFKLENNILSDVSFRHLYYKDVNYRTLEENDPLYGITAQHLQLAEYLEGKPLNAIAELHHPENFIDDVDVATGATLRANKVYSAMRDALNRGIYAPSNGYTKDLTIPEDGRYRGTYGDRGDQQVAIQFSIENGKITNLSYRHLYHSGNDYLAMEETDALYGIYEQHLQILAYLDGQPVETIYDLHNPGEFVEDVDVATGATIRANKVFSAIMNGLSKGLY